MIFRLFPRVAVKLGDERYIFDRATLMFTEVQEIEKAAGLSYGEWDYELGRHSITAIAALLHVLRQRAGQPSDFKSMNFAAASLDVVPLHDDDREYTPEEIAAELDRRVREAAEGAGPTRAAGAPGVPSGGTGSTPRQLTKGLSPSTSESGHGNGNGSHGRTGSTAKRTLTGS